MTAATATKMAKAFFGSDFYCVRSKGQFLVFRAERYARVGERIGLGCTGWAPAFLQAGRALGLAEFLPGSYVSTMLLRTDVRDEYKLDIVSYTVTTSGASAL